MKRFFWAALVVGLGHGAAAAQVPGGPAVRPSFSPYLNLLRQGNPGYLNYYGLVRPQLQTQQALGNLQGQVQANTLGLNQLTTATGTSAAGQGFGYFTHRAYFMNNAGGGGAAGGGQAAATGSAPRTAPTSRNGR